MGIIIMLVVGGVIGWLASLVMRTDGSQGILLNIVVGLVGALIGGAIFGPMLGSPPITSGVIDFRSLLVSLLGAIVLLGIINLLRRGALR